MNQYTPIDCNVYDELLAKATQKAVCDISFLSEKAVMHKTSAVIVDVYTKTKEEFMLLDNGVVIRLDRILSVDGITVNEHTR